MTYGEKEGFEENSGRRKMTSYRGGLLTIKAEIGDNTKGATPRVTNTGLTDLNSHLV